MVASFCRLKLEEAIILVKFLPFSSLFFCVLNFIFSLMACVGNLLVIYALWKSSSIPAKKLLLNLAFSDLAVGIYVQPFFAVIMVVMLSKVSSENNGFNYLCPTIITVTMFFAYFLSGVSFFTIAATAFDRFLAVTLHLRYQALVTDKRTSIGLVILWLATGLATFALVALPSGNNLVAVVVQSMGFLVITAAYFRIYQVVRRHRNQIHSQHRAQNGQTIRTARENKSALNAFYVYIISLACYFPSLVTSILLEVNHLNNSYVGAAYASIFLFFLNSSLNPLVYCWRYREIRNTVRGTVNKIYRINDHTAHHVTCKNISTVYPQSGHHTRQTANTGFTVFATQRKRLETKIV